MTFWTVAQWCINGLVIVWGLALLWFILTCFRYVNRGEGENG